MGCAASVPDEDKQHRKGKGKGKGKGVEPAPPASNTPAETATTTTTTATVPPTEQPKTVETTTTTTTPPPPPNPAEQPADPKPAAQPHTEQPKPAEQHPVESKPTEQLPAEPKPEQPHTEQSKPAEQPPVDQKPAEAPHTEQPKPAEPENKHDTSVPTETKPEEPKSTVTTNQLDSAPTRQAKIAVVYYSMYGHILQLAEVVAEGIRSAGAIADIYQVRETLSEEILQKMHAPPKAAHPIVETATLKDYDGLIFGIPTRYGIWPTQWKTFLDSTGQLWQSGALHGKMGAVFTSTASQHGGIETTAFTAITFFAHHGISFVPLGYAKAFPELTNLDEIVGGTPYGAGTMAGGDGSRQPTDIEKRVCLVQGETFAETVKKQFC